MEVGEVILSFDILRKEKENEYTLLNSFYLAKSKNTFDATQGNFGRLYSTLYDAILLVARNTDYNKKGKLLDLGFGSELPILIERPKNGFYITYSELANNSAETDLKFTQREKSKNKGSNTIIFESTDNIPNRCFAYFNGQNFYLNSNFYNNSDYFIKTYRIDNFLLFTENFIADNWIESFTIAKGKSGYDYVKSRRPIMFNLSDGKFYNVSRDKMGRLLEKKYPDLYKKFKKYKKKDVVKIYDILKFIFENEDKEKVREILVG